MSNLSTRSRAEAQRDIAVAALRSIATTTYGDRTEHIVGEALARITEIEATKPGELDTFTAKAVEQERERCLHWASWGNTEQRALEGIENAEEAP